MNKPLLIIKTGNTITELQNQGTDFEDWFCEGLNLNRDEVLVVSVHLGEALPPIESVSAIIITGSPAYITDLEDWNFVAAEYIKAAFDLALPMLGVCYGHQLIAWAFGGEVDFHPQGREIGTVGITLHSGAVADKLFKVLPKELAVNVSHQQSVIRLPAGAELLASNDFEPNHGYRLGDCTWGVQFHPEFSADVTKAYINARRENIQQEGLDVEGLLAGVTDTSESAAMLSRFLSIALEGDA